jgi:hypothetical protein
MDYKKIVKSYISKKSKNEPSNKELWDKIQDLVAGRKKFIVHKGEKIIGPRDGKGFLIHPSAYSNGFASKLYKELGGTWKKVAKSKRDKGSEHGGLDAWFDKKTPWGDWVAITPVKKTITLENGKKKTYKPGDIVGPCGISSSKEWKDVTDNGRQPLKCMARPQAEKYTRKERAELAKYKRKKEKEQGKSTKVTLTPSFGDKAKKIIDKKSFIEKIIYKISKNKIKWTKPSLQEEMDEFKRYKENYSEKFDSGKLITLEDEMWSKINNTDSYNVRSLEEARSLSKEYGRDIELFTEASELPAPIVVKKHDGSLELIAGNTRLMWSKALKIKPKIYLIDLSED